jgi:hypothetical protein
MVAVVQEISMIAGNADQLEDKVVPPSKWGSADQLLFKVGRQTRAAGDASHV